MKYFLKTKGTIEIPDYLQIRDKDFQLIAHCTVKNAPITIKKHRINIKHENIVEFIKELPFGKLIKIEE